MNWSIRKQSTNRHGKTLCQHRKGIVGSSVRVQKVPHLHIHGKPVTVKLDYKPLQNIQQNNIGSAPQRLQRMLLRIQPYDCTIEYKPGREMTIADYLSRVNPKAGETIGLNLGYSHAVTVTD
ncbi:retrovirus-related pol polyprotein from transposon 17.6 [Plakobranchus ocellatus]|uniref:Retrovirus-related pol polyprotein from transposon 17.6 n=1 Tax=Plakobranchus ocellatus TaxID=259542 RepID=A0AAV3YUT3_9GAST|nr:retrovirus-related pol polyprotein from transposon 17.6 [Plakobranchus ocellatus]